MFGVADRSDRAPLPPDGDRRPRGNYRTPDVAVDCGPYRPGASESSEPVLVAEVWSKGTHWIDTTRKLEDYSSVPTIRHVLFLSQDDVRGQLWTRDGDWIRVELDGRHSSLVLVALDLTLSLDAINEGLGLS